MTQSQFKTLITLLISLVLSAQTMAQDAKPLKYYDVEIVIFKNLKVPKGSEQILPVQAPVLEPPFIDLSDPQSVINAQSLGYTTPTYEELRLNEQVKKIERSSRYQLLVHTAWRQPGLAINDVLSYKILAGQTFNNDYSNIDAPTPERPEFSLIMKPESELTPIQPQTKTPEQQTTEQNLVWYELEGNIKISLARYLHAYVDLVLRVPNQNKLDSQPLTNSEKLTQASFATETLNNFALKEHRRMRSKRLHYLDNPEFGMLILITPYEAPLEESLKNSDKNSENLQ